MQLVFVLFLLAGGVFIMYYLPLISKDLHKITKQNEEIIKLLEKKIDRDEGK
ncbi:hypothetical protein JOC75_000431 [Metabacillus crassostreae]|uniref:hypothetical protein n=1 Tax=Metabacillus crassostreae TaxID=929098 RepID=UPI00195EEB92|nr:hypothetical protein [Metabacillus crassostreae]MBM7602461.1 hypothetical protein [Metabacillus crassostreae]